MSFMGEEASPCSPAERILTPCETPDTESATTPCGQVQPGRQKSGPEKRMSCGSESRGFRAESDPQRNAHGDDENELERAPSSIERTCPSVRIPLEERQGNIVMYTTGSGQVSTAGMFCPCRSPRKVPSSAEAATLKRNLQLALWRQMLCVKDWYYEDETPLRCVGGKGLGGLDFINVEDSLPRRATPAGAEERGEPEAAPSTPVGD